MTTIQSLIYVTCGNYESAVTGFNMAMIMCAILGRVVVWDELSVKARLLAAADATGKPINMATIMNTCDRDRCASSHVNVNSFSMAVAIFFLAIQLG